MLLITAIDINKKFSIQLNSKPTMMERANPPTTLSIWARKDNYRHILLITWCTIKTLQNHGHWNKTSMVQHPKQLYGFMKLYLFIENVRMILLISIVTVMTPGRVFFPRQKFIWISANDDFMDSQLKSPPSFMLNFKQSIS